MILQAPWIVPVNTDRPTEPLTEEGVEAIHNGAMRILEEIGIDFLNEEALELFKADRRQGERLECADGARLGDGDGGKAPSEFTITPRNPDRQITIGGETSCSATSRRRPIISIWRRRKSRARVSSAHDLLKLTQYFNCIHFAGGYPVEPVDVHASNRHLDVVYDKMTLTDKVMHAYALGKERVEDVMEMVKIAGGLTEEEFQSRPHMYTNINSTSPLKHDQPMIDGCLRLVRRGQAVIVTPFTLAGAMAPVTMAGAVRSRSPRPWRRLPCSNG